MFFLFLKIKFIYIYKKLKMNQNNILKNKIETQQLTKKTYIKKYMPKSWHR